MSRNGTHDELVARIRTARGNLAANTLALGRNLGLLRLKLDPAAFAKWCRVERLDLAAAELLAAAADRFDRVPDVAQRFDAAAMLALASPTAPAAAAAEALRRSRRRRITFRAATRLIAKHAAAESQDSTEAS